MAEQTLKNSAIFKLRTKGEGNVVTTDTIQALRGSGDKLHSFLNFGTTWAYVVSFRLRLLYPYGKNLNYPLNKKLDRS
jgi:hypothetical protein